MNVSWHGLMTDIEACRRCRLRETCSRTVPGEGNPEADLMFIGEGPGADEDRLGRPFVGRAGALLTKMIEAMGLRREDVYICNVVKCRPPQNRQPQPDEMQACLPFLRGQVALVRPSFIALLGATAGRAVLGPDFRVTRDRGVFVEKKGVRIHGTFVNFLDLSPEIQEDIIARLDPASTSL